MFNLRREVSDRYAKRYGVKLDPEREVIACIQAWINEEKSTFLIKSLENPGTGLAEVSRAIERAQKQVEQRNFEIRKHLLEYDDVHNEQRREIYSHRRELLQGKEQREYVLTKGQEILDMLVEECIVVENKTVDTLLPIHTAQLLTYLHLSGHRIGFLLNWNVMN